MKELLAPGSIEKYTEEMKYNLEHFSKIMASKLPEESQKVAQKTDKFYEE